jgi:hypothetical protein
VIRRAAIVLGLPVLVVGLAAVPLGLWRGPHQWLCATVALGLTVTPGLVTLVLSDRLARGSPYGAITALFLGTFVRLAVGFGGAVVVFLAAGDTFRRDPVSFWGWLLGAYLTTLAVETAVLGRQVTGGSGKTPGDPV